MTLKTFIRDGHEGTGHMAGVSNAGELVITGFGSISGINTKFNIINLTNTAFNFFIPMSTQNFIITSVLLNTPAAATNIDIYEASSATSTTIDKELLSVNTSSKGFIPIILPIGGFIPVTEGEFLNSKTDNATVNMTIIGFYRPIN